MKLEFPQGAALVVGGSGGIGRVVCREFARAGCPVALTWYKNESAAQKVAEKVQEAGVKASLHQLTFSDHAQVSAAVEAAAQEHGRLHTIVVVAGSLAEQVFISQMTREQWYGVIEQDLNGFFHVVRASLPLFRGWGGGNYIHLGSCGHLRWPDRDVLSVVPKAAIEALVRGIAREEGRFGIRANSVLGGVIEAGMFLRLSHAFDDRWKTEALKNLAIKRWGRAEEVAYAVMFLASRQAAYVTGQQIAVAGGYGL